MELHYTSYGEGKPLVIVHGLFGSSDNWISLAKKFSSYFTVYLLDMRNHGQSPWSDSHTYEDMADDIYAWALEQNISEMYLLGHSMGGKVGMYFAQQYPHLLKKLIVVDMGIKEYPMHHQQILKGIHSLDLHAIHNRTDADVELKKHIEPFGIRQFLLKNLYWIEKGKLAWRMNVPIIEAFMPDILAKIPNKEVWIQTLFIRGALSDYILDGDLEEIEAHFPDSDFISIPNAGHWVHAEQAEPFSEAVLGFCLR